MSQFLSQVAAQVLRQEQRLTPQLIQSMDILQLPLMALETRINQELEQNPVLEYSPPATESLPDESAAAGEGEPDNAVEWLDSLSRQYDFDPGDRPYAARRSDEEADAKMEAMANTAGRTETLSEYLGEQWSFVDADRPVKRAGQIIINQLDDDGFLRTPLSDLTRRTDPPLPLEDLQAALALIQQQLEPVGVGARDLRECLLIQLYAQDEFDPLAERLIQSHLHDIEQNRYPAMVQATGEPIERIKEAVAAIGKLNPRPGMLVVEREVPRVQPDVIVEYDEAGEGYTVRLARGNNPRLRISKAYRQMIRDRSVDPNARDFLRRNLEAASAIIEAIQYRRQRLLDVACIVVERQRDFLDLGPEHLKILRMNELAEQLGCDPSTISRTVAEKYMQTPRGIFPLRYFFTGGTESDNGEATSWDAVKARVQAIVDAEDKHDPLPDDQIAERLKTEGINVSRRTIAKYRAQLGIPPIRNRREY